MIAGYSFVDVKLNPLVGVAGAAGAFAPVGVGVLAISNKNGVDLVSGFCGVLLSFRELVISHP